MLSPYPFQGSLANTDRSLPTMRILRMGLLSLPEARSFEGRIPNFMR